MVSRDLDFSHFLSSAGQTRSLGQTLLIYIVVLIDIWLKVCDYKTSFTYNWALSIEEALGGLLLPSNSVGGTWFRETKGEK